MIPSFYLVIYRHDGKEKVFHRAKAEISFAISFNLMKWNAFIWQLKASHDAYLLNGKTDRIITDIYLFLFFLFLQCMQQKRKF